MDALDFTCWFGVASLWACSFAMLFAAFYDEDRWKRICKCVWDVISWVGCAIAAILFYCAVCFYESPVCPILIITTGTCLCIHEFTSMKSRMLDIVTGCMAGFTIFVYISMRAWDWMRLNLRDPYELNQTLGMIQAVEQRQLSPDHRINEHAAIGDVMPLSAKMTAIEMINRHLLRRPWFDWLDNWIIWRYGRVYTPKPPVYTGHWYDSLLIKVFVAELWIDEHCGQERKLRWELSMKCL